MDLFCLINLSKSNKYFLIKQYAYRFQGNCSSSAPLQQEERPTLGGNPRVSMRCLQSCKTFLLSAAGPKRNVPSTITALEQDSQACRFLWLHAKESCTSGRPPPPPAPWAAVPVTRAAPEGGRLAGKLRSPYFLIDFYYSASSYGIMSCPVYVTETTCCNCQNSHPVCQETTFFICGPRQSCSPSKSR